MGLASNRSQYFDNAKFILIFLVVFGHVISPLKGKDNFLFTLYTTIFLFHMPAFILISGYFAKGYRKKGYLLKVAKKILLPYLIFQVIYSLFYYWSGQEDSLTINLLRPHWTLWFLLSAFCWNVFLYLFAKLKWYGFAISLLMGVGIGYFDQVGSFLSISRTFVFFPYFLLGFLLKPEQLKRLIKAKFSLPIGIVIMTATFILFGTGFPKDSVSWLLGDTSYAGMGGEEWTDGLIRALQYAGTLLVVFSFLALIPSAEFKLTVIGERTLYVYLFHGFIIQLTKAFLSDDALDAISGQYFVLIVFSFLICLLLGSYLIKKYTKPLVELRL
ncbi:acyltransferase family protein [Neobacillus sp. SM06]|uniref:acyltransferase family protein n=1 Tax=Neobacillus sp. SM06 TaxID=3422492 RepID=UPI003D29947C